MVESHYVRKKEIKKEHHQQNTKTGGVISRWQTKILREKANMLKVDFYSKDMQKQRTLRKQSKLKNCCQLMPKWAIISYKNPLRSYWDFIPMALSAYNAFMIPVSFSFNLSFEFLQINDTIDSVLDYLFLFDNILMFFTSCQNK